MAGRACDAASASGPDRGASEAAAPIKPTRRSDATNKQALRNSTRSDAAEADRREAQRPRDGKSTARPRAKKSRPRRKRPERRTEREAGKRREPSVPPILATLPDWAAGPNPAVETLSLDELSIVRRRWNRKPTRRGARLCPCWQPASNTWVTTWLTLTAHDPRARTIRWG
jgi:hypothetical protein